MILLPLKTDKAPDAKSEDRDKSGKENHNRKYIGSDRVMKDIRKISEEKACHCYLLVKLLLIPFFRNIGRRWFLQKQLSKLHDRIKPEQKSRGTCSEREKKDPFKACQPNCRNRKDNKPLIKPY